MSEEIIPPRRGRLVAEPEVEAVAEEAAATVVAEEPATPAVSEPPPAPVVVAAVEPESKDIGNWKYTPWRGKPMWTNRGNSAWTSFDSAYVRKHRHLTKDPSAKD